MPSRTAPLIRLLVASLALTAAAAPLTASPGTASGGAAPKMVQPAVIGKEVIGHSVKGRPIVAWHLGHTHRTKVVLIGAMHGNEADPRIIMDDLRDGEPVHGINLWVVPTYNPDGVVRDTRKNAHGVDLNRNYPYEWKRLTGSYYSGPKPASEPETRAMMRFLSDIKPDYVLSFHQPLYSVDVNTKRPKFSRKVAKALGLPTSNLDCGSSCHGTMTMWFNHKFPGFALTVEYGSNPPRARLVKAAGAILHLFGASRG